MTTRNLLFCGVLAISMFGCGGNKPDDTSGNVFVAETLDPEPAGSPTDAVDGRLSCLDQYKIAAPSGTALELTGYVRTLADPDAATEPPEATIEVFSAGGSSLGSAFSDASREGRSAVSVPIDDEGYTGYAMITADGYLPERFEVSIPVTDSTQSGWAFLATAAERDAVAADLGATVGAGDGVLVGSVHDCDGFATGNVLVTVDRVADGVLYVEGFAPVASRTWTGSAGRFAIALPAGEAVVEAWTRLEAGGPLTLISSLQTTVAAGAMTAVALEPRPAAK